MTCGPGRYFEACNTALTSVLGDLNVSPELQSRKGLSKALGDPSALYVPKVSPVPVGVPSSRKSRQSQ